MENVLLTQSRSKNFLFVLNNIRYHFFFLSFDKMPQMYKWSNEHDLVVKHKRHATSNNLVGFLVFRKTRCMFSNVRFSITFLLTKKLNYMLMKVWRSLFNPKERCLHFVSLPQFLKYNGIIGCKLKLASLLTFWFAWCQKRFHNQCVSKLISLIRLSIQWKNPRSGYFNKSFHLHNAIMALNHNSIFFVMKYLNKFKNLSTYCISI